MHSSIMSKNIAIKTTLLVLVLTFGIATISFFITETSAQNATQANQTGNQTGNQTSSAPALGSASQGSSGSTGPQY